MTWYLGLDWGVLCGSLWEDSFGDACIPDVMGNSDWIGVDTDPVNPILPYEDGYYRANSDQWNTMLWPTDVIGNQSLEVTVENFGLTGASPVSNSDRLAVVLRQSGQLAYFRDGPSLTFDIGKYATGHPFFSDAWTLAVTSEGDAGSTLYYNANLGLDQGINAFMFRAESDTNGDWRVLFNDTIIASGTDPREYVGGSNVGVMMDIQSDIPRDYLADSPRITNICIDGSRSELGSEWMQFPYPDETESNPASGAIMPIILNGAMVHPTSGSATQVSTEKRASVVRVEPVSDCNAQFVSARIEHVFQTATGGSDFRAHVDLILLADPATGSHMLVQFRSESDNGISNLRFFLVGVRFYYGAGGSDFELGESMASGFELGAIGDENVYFLNAVIWKDTRRYMVTLDGVTILDGIAPIAIPWGLHQGASIRWSNGTEIDGDFISPTIEEIDGGSSDLPE